MTNTFDLIVIGAGINGAGVARDAAMRGLKVCVLDKADVAAGTSSASTRLIHGGLRYLEHWEFGLVRESLQERETLLKIAPHLVKPIPILIPIYKNARRGPVHVRAGMILYDLLSSKKTLPPHRMLSRDETLKLAPGLNPDRLTASAVYYDAQVEFAERLVLENLIDARTRGSEIVTYARVTNLVNERGKVSGIEFTSDSERRNVSGKFVVNAAGPWIDELFQTTNNTNRLIGGTKGSHLVMGPFAGAPSMAIYAEAQSDGRPFFIIPWNGNYLVGTTDIRFSGEPDDAHCSDAEVDYLLMESNRVLPEANLTRDHILLTYSGVRPLPFTNQTDEQRITRRHFICQHPELENVWSLVGGKLTTYRQLAEELVDLVSGRLSQPRPRRSTADVTLPGAKSFDSFANDFRSDRRFSSEVRERLLRVYGSRTKQLLEVCARDPELLQTLNDASHVLAGEIVFSFEQEMATTLTDCLVRRTMCGFNANLAIGEDEKAAEIARRFLGWSAERATHEVEDYRRYTQKFLLPHA